jgi:3-deoxy-D-manno-octulosonic acid kinase
LLKRLVEMQLPVPNPVAGRFVRRGAIYTADLITVRIPGAVPFSHRWAAGALEPGAWHRVGELVGRFHGHRVFHADLNAHNIQIDDEDDLFLLDFDRGRIMPGAGAWTERNLDRLQRSLHKIGRSSGRELRDQDWNHLLRGYRLALNVRG